MLRLLATIAVIALVPCFAHAQNLAADAGPFEVTFAASGDNNRGFTSGGADIGGSFGFFVLPFLEISARDAYSWENAGNGDNWENTARGAIDFNIPLGNLEPYFGANVGYFATHDLGSSPEAAPEIGLKWLFTKHVFIYGQAEYDFFWRNSGNTFNNGEFVYGIGLGLRF
jgi:hypothetical protein